MRNLLPVTTFVCALAMLAPAQTQPPAAKPTTVVRTTKALHYRTQGSSVKIAFQGTDAMSSATGEAKVEGKKTNIEIDAKFQGLEDATKFGLEYLTYVLWAVSPQGRAVNLGEVALKNGAGQVKAITDMQTFGRIVTAEPYYAVVRPSSAGGMPVALWIALSPIEHANTGRCSAATWGAPTIVLCSSM